MNICIFIDTSNAAFDEHAGCEIGRILKHMARDFSDGLYDADLALPFTSLTEILRDLNGNSCGQLLIARELTLSKFKS